MNEDAEQVGLSTRSQDTPLVTGLQVDFVPLITTCWAQSFSQFSSPPHRLLIESILRQLPYEGFMEAVMEAFLRSR